MTKIVEEWGKHLAGLQSFGVAIKSTTQIKQGELTQAREVSLRVLADRPNKLLVKLTSGGDSADLVCDGKSMAVSLASAGKYFVDNEPDRLTKWETLLESQVPAAIASEGNMGVVTLALLAERPAERLLSSMVSATYGGEVTLGDAKCHLIRAVGREAEFELWIDAGKKPLLRQFAPDLNKALAKQAAKVGKPAPTNVRVTCVATYRDWQENPILPADAFAFRPAKGLVKIDNPADQEEPPHPLLGTVAPAIDIDLLGGGKLDLAALKGKNVVILDFWATWCGPCIRAMPQIEKVAAEFKNKGVVLYAVNLEETPAEVQRFAEQNGVTAKIALDSAGTVVHDYQATLIPQTVLIGKDGTIQVVHVGLPNNPERQLRKELDALLAGKDLAAEKKARAAKAQTSATEPNAGGK